MPTHQVKGGYRWGKHGKVYPTKKQADKQGQAIYASGWRESIEKDIVGRVLREVLERFIIEDKLNEKRE